MVVDHYPTQDGTGTDYAFGFEEVSSGDWRAYILSQPPYNGRDADMHATHRLGLGTERPYVCWTETIGSLGDAKAVASAWADRTQRYIRDGVRFEDQS